MGIETLGDRGKSVRYLSAAKYNIVQIVYISFRLYGSINNKPYVTKHNLEKQSTTKECPVVNIDRSIDCHVHKMGFSV